MKHQSQRVDLQQEQKDRGQLEQHQQIARLPRGLTSIWHRMTGKYQKIQQQNKQESQHWKVRDRDERQTLITRQLQERLRLQERVLHVRNQHNHVMLELRQDIGRYNEMSEQALEKSQTVQHQHANDVQHGR